MDLRQAHEQSTFKADEGGVIVAGIGSEAEGKLRLMLFVIPLELTIGNKALEEGADQKVVDCKLPTGRDAKAIFYLNPQMAE